MLQDLLQKKNQVSTERLDLDNLVKEGTTGAIEMKSQQIQHLIGEIERGVGLLEEMGCLVRHIDEGIVDFPAVRYGKQVYLCWRLGEPEVSYWHDMKSGFAGRSRISESEIAKAYV